MLFNIMQERKLIGFTYYPVLEIVLGIFFLFVSFFIPLLFARYNGFKFIQQWDEWLFLLFFFILFFMLGKNLSYQNMRVEIKGNKIVFMQDMRLPAVSIEMDITNWKGSSLKTIKENEGIKKIDPLYSIFVIENELEKPFYESRSLKEAKIMSEALDKLYYVNKGEENGKK